MSSAFRYSIQNGIGLLTTVLVVHVVCAQTPGLRATTRAPLDVRPHEMATATTNPAAGEYLLDSLPVMTPKVRKNPYRVYVPAQCVGAHRCPLLLHLHGADRHSGYGLGEYRRAADKHGLIILAATAVRREWTVGYPGQFSLSDFELDRKNIEAALQQVLRTFAIDPSRIAISCVSQGCWPAQILGGTNMNVFNRIIMFGGPVTVAALDPPTAKVELLSISEDPLAAESELLERHRALQHAGYRSTFVAALAPHGVWPAESDFVGQWLLASWTEPDPSKRTPPRVIDPLPLLTPQSFAQLVKAWHALPPALSWDGMYPYQRLEYFRETIVPVLADRVSTVMVDMPAAARALPAVATALTIAGLSADQYDALRLALISAHLTLAGLRSVSGAGSPVSIDSTSVMGRNVSFLKDHAEVADIAKIFTNEP